MKGEFFVYFTKRFTRSYDRVPFFIQQDFDARIEFFKQNIYHPILHTHKLHGGLSACYSFYLRDGYRVLFEFVKDKKVFLLDIGAHDEYERW